ncbi:MAG: hypothetical protein HFJ54_03645 [Clostridia bacterium]|nr:hypothetical protein [Clostridia bacterium]
MKRKLAIMFFLLTISIFFISYIKISIDICESRKIVLIGKAIILNQEAEVYETQKGNIIPTSSNKMGILTGVDSQSGKYVAFAHELPNIQEENELENIICYEVENLKIKKSDDKIIGSLTAKFNENERIGNVIENKITGISGIIDNMDSYCKNEREVYISSKYRIKKGPATVYIDLDGNGAKEYSAEILAINYRDETKNIRIKITDTELLEKTGGIVQGMSGTPVLQNGKLIGAINSVTLCDNTEGYATFATSLFE